MLEQQQENTISVDESKLCTQKAHDLDMKKMLDSRLQHHKTWQFGGKNEFCIFLSPPPTPPICSCNTQQQSDHTRSLHKSTWWKWDGKAELVQQQRPGHFFYFFSSWKPMWHYGIKSALQGGSCIISMYDAFLRRDDLEQSSYLYMVALYLLSSSSQFWIPRGRW